MEFTFLLNLKYCPCNWNRFATCLKHYFWKITDPFPIFFLLLKPTVPSGSKEESCRNDLLRSLEQKLAAGFWQTGLLSLAFLMNIGEILRGGGVTARQSFGIKAHGHRVIPGVSSFPWSLKMILSSAVCISF